MGLRCQRFKYENGVWYLGRKQVEECCSVGIIFPIKHWNCANNQNDSGRLAELPFQCNTRIILQVNCFVLRSTCLVSMSRSNEWPIYQSEKEKEKNNDDLWYNIYERCAVHILLWHCSILVFTTVTTSVTLSPLKLIGKVSFI